MQIKETTVFQCSPERLWSYLDEPDKQKLWMKGLLSNEPTGPKPKGVGSTFRMVIQEGRRSASYDGDVTVYERPRRLEVRVWGGNLPRGMIMRVDYRLTDLGGQTRLDYQATCEGTKPGLLVRMLFVLFKLFGQMQLRSFLRKLRTLVESPAAA
jgi:carbon monoxide dehydrogenase subunit G